MSVSPDDPMVAVSTLNEGDMIDLENDRYADFGDDPSFESEYAVVAGTAPGDEPSAIVVHFEGLPSVQFPRGHEVPYGGRFRS